MLDIGTTDRLADISTMKTQRVSYREQEQTEVPVSHADYIWQETREY